MSKFTTKCPHCSTELMVEEEWINMEAECPTCKQTFIIPKEYTAQDSVTVKTYSLLTREGWSPASRKLGGKEKKSFIFVCPECGTQVELPIALQGSPMNARPAVKNPLPNLQLKNHVRIAAK